MMVGDRQVASSIEIERHRAAIVRSDLSRPVKTAVESGVFAASATFFDYGCGHGGDVERIGKLGFEAHGWDPYFRPDNELVQADVVNLGYIVNVIEDAVERRQALEKAWALTNKVMIVSAQVLLDYLGDNVIAYGDGVLTKRNTFQKVFKQEELKQYIDSTLNVDAVPAGLGIYFIFKHDPDAEAFRASRFHSRRSTPQVRLRIKSFDEYQDLLKPLIDFVSDRGRMPLRGELLEEKSITKELGSIHRAFKLVVDATSKDEWDELIEKRRQDLSLYIALSKFGKRPRIGQLPHEIQNDIKALFGTYKSACDQADQMLFGLGQPGVIAKTCAVSKIGKFVPDGLYVHISAVDQLDLTLRLYEGCASRTVGRMDGATLVKFHTDKPKISYLFYPDFDSDPHPALHTSVRIDLQDLHTKYSDYATSENPPILHRKETFVAPSYPLYDVFSQLTKQEEELGLLTPSNNIGNRRAWAERLKNAGVYIADHQLRFVNENRSDVAASASFQSATEGQNQTDVDDQPHQQTEARFQKEAIESSKFGGVRNVNFSELKSFINVKMSTSHMYQPVIILVLLEESGTASLDAIAARCAQIGNGSADSYKEKLVKYPKQALTKHGVLSQSSKNEFRLACDVSNMPESDKVELTRICQERLALVKKRD